MQFVTTWNMQLYWNWLTAQKTTKHAKRTKTNHLQMTEGPHGSVMLLSGVEIILSDNSHYWVVLTSFYLTSCIVEWCQHILSNNSCCRVLSTLFHPTNHADGLWWHHFIWQFASELILMFCAMAGSIMLPNIQMCPQLAPTCWQFNVVQLTNRFIVNVFKEGPGNVFLQFTGTVH